MNDIITDIKALQEETLLNLQSSKANNTVKAYKSDFNDFGIFAVGVFLNAFQTPIAQEIFGIKGAFAELNSWDSLEVWIKNWPR